ncbi:MAG: prephenate dehydrogenase/arogenate dehydrogenase family protein [Firmicutes bacterium]|nr:prephenate dehydrogenase/arogenate dehydrogenase family protein [Bacillota bacterium]
MKTEDRARPKVAILGLGLMGGSLGLILTKAGYPVSGWARKPSTIEEAYRIGAINIKPASEEDAVHDAKYVFVATPVSLIAEKIKACIPWTAPGTIFSDLGSIKGAIMAEVFSFLPPTHYFVAAHPMTGSDQQGIGAADPFLYQNAIYIVIDDPRTPAWAAQEIRDLLKLTGANLVTLTGTEHDRIVAMVSHLPHLLAAALAKTAGLAEEAHPGTLNFAAGGFRDTTRVAMGAPEIWEGIILGNKSQVLEAIDAFCAQLEQLKEIIHHGDQGRLSDFLTKAKETRQQIPAKNKGFLSLLYEMVITVEDRPGAINEVLVHLAKEGINIKDIEILRVREGEGGTVRLAFENDRAVDRAVQILEKQGYVVRKR